MWARNLARELAHLGRSFKVLRSLDTLIIAGGGQLCELWRGPWSHPYNVFKFSVLTKLANRKLLFLNVGAGPLNSFLGRAFVKCSVYLADYVSFRDVESQTLVHRPGGERQTHVFPDSAYALDISEYEIGNAVSGVQTAGWAQPHRILRPSYLAEKRCVYLFTLSRQSSCVFIMAFEPRLPVKNILWRSEC